MGTKTYKKENEARRAAVEKLKGGCTKLIFKKKDNGWSVEDHKTDIVIPEAERVRHNAEEKLGRELAESLIINEKKEYVKFNYSSAEKIWHVTASEKI